MKKKLLAIIVILFAAWGLLLSQAICMNEQPDPDEELKILTWNIFMRPRFIFKDGQVERAKAIVEQLKDKTYDVIVFQEAIDRKARRIIWDGLKAFFSISG